MGNLIVVGISDMKIIKGKDVLITYALGSCIGTCLYDKVQGIMGLSHILLPQNNLCTSDANINKFADTAIKELVKKMKEQGASVHRITAKIAGGAQMFANSNLKIGERNTQAVISELNELGIKIIGCDVGHNYGRTMECHCDDGRVVIKSIIKGNSII